MSRLWQAATWAFLLAIVFLSLAFHSLDFLAGQVVGKAWAVLVSLPGAREIAG